MATPRLALGFCSRSGYRLVRDDDAFHEVCRTMDHFESAYAMTVLLGGFALLTVLAIRGYSIFVVAPLCALAILTLSGADPLAGMKNDYMREFADYLRRFYLIF